MATVDSSIQILIRKEKIEPLSKKEEEVKEVSK